MSGGETVVQLWEGYVLALDADGFDARLIDLTAGETVEGDEARVPWTTLSEGRPDGIRQGTYLRWSILAGPGNTSRSVFEFDIAGAWTAEDLERAKACGAELAAGLRVCFEGTEASAADPAGTGGKPAS